MEPGHFVFFRASRAALNSAMALGSIESSSASSIFSVGAFPARRSATTRPTVALRAAE